MWKRFTVRWTPTVLILGPDGSEGRRIEGYLPADEMLAQIELGLGFLAVNRKDWSAARQEFERVERELPNTAGGPEALYWLGVANYSASHDASALKETARWFRDRYTDTAWAKRASIWQ
jgi:TolA-binding protein